MQFLVWYDDNAKTPLVDKIQAAMAAYLDRFKRDANVVLVNMVDHVDMPDVTIHTRPNVSPNTFWIGREDGLDRPAAERQTA